MQEGARHTPKAVNAYHHEQEIPIAVYEAIDGSLPFAPFVAYPMVPTVGAKGERTLAVAVRCPGETAEQAREAAAEWWRDEVARQRKAVETANTRRAAAIARAESRHD